jgi:hypothetical protein
VTKRERERENVRQGEAMERRRSHTSDRDATVFAVDGLPFVAGNEVYSACSRPGAPPRGRLFNYSRRYTSRTV